jgi:drug/metabolite transporter (DMT)-like permease
VEKKSIGIAILAASLYGISAPVSKLLLVELSPTLMAALLYLGAGFGMLMVNMVKMLFKQERLEARMTRRELPYVISMILLDIAAPIFLMLGLTLTTSSTASLLNNFEIVATAMIALFIFNEAVGKRMWIAIILITLSSVILSVDDFGSLSFSVGSLFVVLACICWGFENNCTRMLSLKDPLQIVVVKGFGSGLGALLITIYRNDMSGSFMYVMIALLLGFVAYGLSIYFYIKAQRSLGAARTSAYYAAAPFIGVIISWIVLKESITNTFLLSLGIMLLGTYFAVSEDHAHKHVHDETRHEHKHSHDDGHHGHTHAFKTHVEQGQEHSHEHVHEGTTHVHKHMPDLHHRHSH